MTDSETQDAYNALGAALTAIGYSPERIRLLAENIPALRFDERLTQLTGHRMKRFTLPDIPEPPSPNTLSIEDFDFSVRTYNCLKQEGVNWAYQLLACTRENLMNIQNFGERNLDEIVDKLAAYGFHLAGEEA